MGSEDRTFRVKFTDEGVAKLRERVREKLKEFMGDYTDDTLVEYVIVLLKNGRRKEQARSELDVFLADDSCTFVSWLWDHLASNLDLYVQSLESDMDEVATKKLMPAEQAGRDESHHMDSDSERGKSGCIPRTRHKREWKGIVRDSTETPPLRSSEVDNIYLEEKNHRQASHGRISLSPRPIEQKKRSRHDERQHDERQHTKEAVSQVTINAPRRLLQFAVRDAVGNSKASGSIKEPSLKRLRSVVSASTGESKVVDCPRRLQSIARVPNRLATVFKAVQEAAEDVARVKLAGSVFDRLGRDTNMPGTTEQVAQFRDVAIEDDEYEPCNQIEGQTCSSYPRRTDYAGFSGNISTMDREIGMGSDLLSDNEGYDDDDVMGHSVVDVSHTSTSGVKKGGNSVMLQYVDKDTDNVVRVARNKDLDQPVSSRDKIVNISVNVNTWKPPYPEPREVVQIESQKSTKDNESETGKSVVRVMKENNDPVMVGNGSAKPAADVNIKSQKMPSSAPGSYSVGRPLEDADSRTIFVSNVHFAASKDSLSRHFNKFGEVRKVIIVTDAATGQPKGSAYVEFMRKEAADNALSLDGTSFMSRILKVVKRSSMHQEAATTVMTWPRGRGSYVAPGYTRVAFSRGIPGAFRPRLPIKPGARSFQWKRDAQATPSESVAPISGNSLVSPTARSLTYIRTEPKPVGNSNAS